MSQRQMTLDVFRKKPTEAKCINVETGEEIEKNPTVNTTSKKRSRSRSTSPKSVSQSGWLGALLKEPGWKKALGPLAEPSNPLLAKIEAFIEEEENKGKIVLPPRGFIFTAFNRTPFSAVKVVLLGQDPYHDIGQAHGLCFSVQPGVPPPPSLKNMYKELTTDIEGFRAPSHGYLQHWADQGILMLNATLTVNAHDANSHSKCGWQNFTDQVISCVSAKAEKPVVFLLWGNFAKTKAKLIDTKRHLVVECAHPSPLSARFWTGCKTFSKCNKALEKLGHTPIDWNLPEKVSL